MNPSRLMRVLRARLCSMFHPAMTFSEWSSGSRGVNERLALPLWYSICVSVVRIELLAG